MSDLGKMCLIRLIPESVGKGASDGGSVGLDRSDCVLYPPYI